MQKHKKDPTFFRKMEYESRHDFYFKYSLAALNNTKRLARKEIASYTNCSQSMIIS